MSIHHHLPPDTVECLTPVENVFCPYMNVWDFDLFYEKGGYYKKDCCRGFIFD